MTTVREYLPEGDFSIMTEMLKKFLSFMNLTVSNTYFKFLIEIFVGFSSAIIAHTILEAFMTFQWASEELEVIFCVCKY